MNTWAGAEGIPVVWLLDGREREESADYATDALGTFVERVGRICGTAEPTLPEALAAYLINRSTIYAQSDIDRKQRAWCTPDWRTSINDWVDRD